MQYNHVRSTTRTTAGAAPSSAVPAGDILAILEPQPAIQLCTTDTAQQTALSIKHITDHAKTSRFRTTAELLSRALGVGVLVTILHVPVATSRVDAWQVQRHRQAYTATCFAKLPR